MKERRCKICFLVLIALMIFLCSGCSTGSYSDTRTRYIYVRENPFWYHTPSYHHHHDYHNRHNRVDRATSRGNRDHISRPSPSRPSRPTPTSNPPPSSNPDRTPTAKSPHDP